MYIIQVSINNCSEDVVCYLGNKQDVKHLLWTLDSFYFMLESFLHFIFMRIKKWKKYASKYSD